MNDIIFYNSFNFSECRFRYRHYTDCRKGANTNYLALMKTGNAKIISDSVTLMLSPGDLFFIPKGLKYQSYWESDEYVSWDSYAFQYLPERTNKQFILQKISYSNIQKEKLYKLSCMENVTCNSVGLLYDIIGDILPVMKVAENSLEFFVLDAATECLNNNPRCQTSEIANACNLSISGLYSFFKRKLGTTPNELRKKILADKAKEMLMTTDIPIERISEQLGFSSSSYFRKIIFEKTGMTPSKIRKSSCY